MSKTTGWDYYSNTVVINSVYQDPYPGGYKILPASPSQSHSQWLSPQVPLQSPWSEIRVQALTKQAQWLGVGLVVSLGFSFLTRGPHFPCGAALAWWGVQWNQYVTTCLVSVVQGIASEFSQCTRMHQNSLSDVLVWMIASCPFCDGEQNLCHHLVTSLPYRSLNLMKSNLLAASFMNTKSGHHNQGT